MRRRKEVKWQSTFERLEARQLLALTMLRENVSATQLASFTSELATLFDTNFNASPTDFTVTINWADGTASSPDITSGTVTGPTPIPGTFQVGGTHTYAQPGSYTPTISVTDSSGKSATDFASVNFVGN